MINKEQLVKSALNIPPINELSAAEYNEKLLALAAEVDRIMLERKDINQLVGENNLEMMKNNHSNHARFIASILMNFDAETLVETILWVFRAYQNHGFNSNYWPAQLDVWIHVLNSKLTRESCEQILPLYNWMIINIPLFEKLKDQKSE